MSHEAEIEQIMDLEDGYLRIKSVEKAGIPRIYAYRYLADHPEIKKAAKGVYLRPDAERDRMYILSLRNKDAVFSHLSAAFLLGLTDNEPFDITVTVPVGYNANHLKEQFVTPVFVDSDIVYEGRIRVATPYGHEVWTFNKERTICDLIRKRQEIDRKWYQEIMQKYFEQKDINLAQLREYADTYHIRSLVEEYILLLYKAD